MIKTRLPRLFGFLALGVLLAPAACMLPQEQARLRLQGGDEALAKQDLDAALAAFKEAVRLDPQLAEGHRKLGQVYKQSGQLARAADSLESAVKLDPLDYSAVFDLGDVYRLLDNLTQAIRAYAAAVKLEPRKFEPRYRLASAYHQQGELERAIEQYDAALKIKSGDAHAWSNLGAAQDEKGATYEAIRAYKRSLECDTQQPVVLVNLATVYLNQDRFETARRTLNAAIKMSPTLSVAHERLGYCHWREQDYDAAVEDYSTAIELNDKNARAYAGFGVVRMTQYLKNPELRDYRDEAVESWHRSLEIEPDQPKLRELIEKYRVKRDLPSLTIE